jgi:hypothetical protein
MNNYVEVTQEIYDTIITPWFSRVHVRSDEYRDNIFMEPETKIKGVVINGEKYRLDDLTPFAMKAVKEFASSVGVKI